MPSSSTPSRPLLGLFVVGLGTSVGPLDFAVNVAFPAITAAFALPTGGIRWVAIVYVLTYGCLLLACGRLGDAIGHRQVFRAGLAIGALAFALCALAPTYVWLLAARTLQGVSIALLLASGPALVTSLFDESRRTWALGAYSSIANLAGITAPLIGGASIAALGWSGVYWFRVPIALLALALLPAVPVLPLPANRPRFDAIGAALLAAGIALLLLAPTLLDAHAAAAAGVLIVGVALAAGASRRRRPGEKPLVARATALDLRFLVPSLGSATIHFTGFAIPLVTPYYFVRVAGYSPVEIGGVLSAWAVGALGGSLLAARIVAGLGVREAAFSGAMFMTAGLGMLVFWPVTANLPLEIVTLLLHGFGVGLFQVAYTDLTVAALPRGDRGVAGGITSLTRTIGVVFSAAAFSALMRTVEARRLAAGADATAAFVEAFHTVFIVACAVCAAFFVLTMMVRGVWFERHGP